MRGARTLVVPVVPGAAPRVVEVATTRAARRRGLLGRDRVAGVLVLVGCRQVHTVGMRGAIDVAFVAADGEVLRVTTMRPGSVSRVVWRSRFVLEGPAGAFAGWGLTRGIRLPVREHAAVAGDAAGER